MGRLDLNIIRKNIFNENSIKAIKKSNKSGG